MRLPWNRNYIEICFHVILTVLFLAGVGLAPVWLPQAKIVIKKTAGAFLAVFAPLLWAVFFTLLLEPLVAFLQRRYEKIRKPMPNRKAGTVLAYLVSSCVLGVVGSWLGKTIGHTDLEQLAEQISGYIRQLGDLLVLFHLKCVQYGILQKVEGFILLWTEQLTAWTEQKVLGLTKSLPQLGSCFLDLAIGATIAFYFLMEKQCILRRLKAVSLVCLGEKKTKQIARLCLGVYGIFAGYLSGQVLDAILLSVLFSIAFLLVGLPYAVCLGILSGFSNLIPYFGAVVACILSAVAGLLSGAPMKAVSAFGLILLLQQVDNIFIVPRIVGKRVELHPVLVLLSLSIFGRLFGFWGLFFAVPLGAICKNAFVWGYEWKKQRQSYQ